MIRDLLTSKKFLAMLASILVYVGGRFGLDLDPAALDRIFTAILVYVGAQGIADNGKSAAKLVMAPAAPALTTTAPSVAAVGLALLVLVIGGVTAPSCAARPYVTSGVGAMIDCQSDNLKAGVAELVPLATQAVMAAVSGDGRHVDTGAIRAAGKAMKSDLARCALATAIAVLATPREPKPGAPMAAPLEVDGGALRAAFEEVRGELGGASYRTSAGVL